MEFTKNLKEAEEFDKFKSKVLKYVLYKKRTESEVREKFREDSDEDKLEQVMEFLKEYNYINDEEYIERSIAEFKNLKNLSLKEINHKLLGKGVSKKVLDNYIYKNREELLEFEINSAKNIFIKKLKSMEPDEIKAYLYKKGYMSESVSIAYEETCEEQ